MSKTEEQIIQALETCQTDKACTLCPYYAPTNMKCISQLASDALELVKKQREEINELTGKHWNEAGQIARYSDELNQFVNTDKKVEEPHCLNLPPIAVEQFMQRFCRGENNE